ncbi:DUF2975 domain-containing protein [Bradyrhizobium sp.]|uniref:DUF2975 domain-containing protein n=1 Tax=Bradyrhizobium sp. TaxID=376 RepID=UPI001DB1AC47|nr:DUF2975 domain-containing protein [Bradyrhizobium sp.]MBI5319581.1 DUF2975 domain-containing protein [Bradyrhizobium sp.]
MPAFANSNRLRRFSNAMVIVTTLGMVLIGVAMCLVFVIPEWTRNLLLARLGEAGRDLALTPDRVAAGAAVMAIPVGVLLFGLWQARALFADFAEGRVFTLTSARRLRNFAGSVLAQAVLGPVSSTALLLAFTFSNPPGSRQLGIALSTNDYLALIIGGVLLAVAWVMVEATRIADEHASFV